MVVLIACEESQRSCLEFRARGHEAYSCDIEPCSGGHPEWHIQSDVLPLLDGNTGFQTQDGKEHLITGSWDLIIAHPPCTYLTNAGNAYFNVEKYGENAIERMKKREEAISFFMRFVDADCERIAIENLVGCMSTCFRKPDQIVDPYLFGDAERKRTCLWLKNLPLLLPTNIVDPVTVTLSNGKKYANWEVETFYLPAKERSKARSKTFPGMAKAFAEQWG